MRALKLMSRVSSKRVFSGKRIHGLVALATECGGILVSAVAMMRGKGRGA